MIYEFLSLESNSTDPKALSVFDYDLAGFDTSRFWTGELIHSFPHDFRIYVEGTPGSLVNNPFSIHIVSESFAYRLREQVASQLELVPTPLFAKSGKKIEGYFLLNCLNMLECIDLKNSSYSKDEDDGTLIVFDAAIDSDKVPDDVSIFRVAEAPDNGVFLRMSLYERLKKIGVSDVELVGVKSSRNAELIDARSRRKQEAVSEESECYQLIMRAKELLQQNRKEGLELARRAAAMTFVPIEMRIGAMGVLERALRMASEYSEALQVCESCLADPSMAQSKRIFERSAARCEWRLGQTDRAITRLKNSLAEEESQVTKDLLLEIESSMDKQ